MKRLTHNADLPDFAGNVFYSARQALRRHASGGNVLIAATVLALAVALPILASTGLVSFH